MLSLYRSPRGSDNSSDEERVIPAGTPYLTKVKGQLVMARHKRSTRIRATTIKGLGGSTAKTVDLTRPMEAAIEFLGEAFGVRGRTQRQRAKSFDRHSPQQSSYAGLPYIPQQALMYSAPLPQRAFSTMPNFSAMPILQQPIQYAVAPPFSANLDFDQLKRIDAHYRSIHGENPPTVTPATIKTQGLDSNTTILAGRHTCGNCGRLRSRRYYAEHPIKPGELPIQEFCRKCQRDASSTSSSRSLRISDIRSNSKHSKTKKKRSNTRLHNKRKVKRVPSKDDLSKSEGSEKQHSFRSKEKKVNAEPMIDQFKKQSRHKVPNKRNVKKHDSDSDITMSQDESSRAEFQIRGRARYRAEKSEVSRRPSSPRIETYRPAARHKHHEIPPAPQSRRRPEIGPDNEPWVPVYQYAQPHKAPYHPGKRQRSYERRSPVDLGSEEVCNHRLSSSQESRIPDESSRASTVTNKKNSFYSSSSCSKESVRRQRNEDASLDEEISSHNRMPDVSRPWSRNEPRPTTRPGLYEMRKPSNTEEASSLYNDTCESDVEQRSKIHGHPGGNYTHYHGDWTINELSPTLRNHRQRRECSKQHQGYRSSRYQDSDLSKLEDGDSDITTSILTSNNLSPAPTPPSFHNRDLPKPLHRQADHEGESHHSSRNERISQYQEAFGFGSNPTTPMPTFSSGTSMKLDPFYAAINTIIDGDINDKENVAKGEAIKHVTFRGMGPVDEQANMAHIQRRWSNAGGNRLA